MEKVTIVLFMSWATSLTTLVAFSPMHLSAETVQLCYVIHKVLLEGRNFSMGR